MILFAFMIFEMFRSLCGVELQQVERSRQIKKTKTSLRCGEIELVECLMPSMVENSYGDTLWWETLRVLQNKKNLEQKKTT